MISSKMKPKRFVFDTNALISAGLISPSINAQALNQAFETGQFAISDATLLEFTEVLFRPKFDRYLSNERRFSIINKIEQDAKRFRVKETIEVCRDPNDNK